MCPLLIEEQYHAYWSGAVLTRYADCQAVSQGRPFGAKESTGGFTPRVYPGSFTITRYHGLGNGSTVSANRKVGEGVGAGVMGFNVGTGIPVWELVFFCGLGVD
jgi:hypothetical protein